MRKSSLPKPDEAWAAAFRRALLAWYGAHRRDLPWRRSDDPYAVWISEMMLQQTQVAQARPYFERFMARFPTVEALAAAPLEDVLKAWEGLGYYARARSLHRAAGRIVADHGGRIPDGMASLSALPGIGPYTAAAVLSIAYGRDHAAVDGNVIRVLSRLFCIRQNPASGPVRQMMADLADRLLPEGRAADFNQAMMELGATVCTPRKPRCGVCPVEDRCRARRELADPSALPVRSPRKARPRYDVTAAAIWREDRLLIVQRPLEGLLGGLWEFPGGRRQNGEPLEQCLIREVAQSTGVAVAVRRPLATVRHAFTHFEITLYGYHCAYVDGDARPVGYDACRWVGMDGLSGYAFSRAHNRLIEAIAREMDYPQLRLFE
jgi:A/G-specific adenine glycosylase